VLPYLIVETLILTSSTLCLVAGTYILAAAGSHSTSNLKLVVYLHPYVCGHPLTSISIVAIVV